jgi:hypothetical protein
MPTNRRLGLAMTGLAGFLLIAAPVFGASPSSRPEKAQKGDEVAVTITGQVSARADAKGRFTYSMTADGVTWDLSAGPKWFWGTANPLAAFVGMTVVVAGTHRAGDTDLDVATVNGKALRAAGKPPWAGGPKVVGAIHPGWNHGRPAKAGKGHGRDGAPGQLKDRTHAPDEDEAGDED